MNCSSGADPDRFLTSGNISPLPRLLPVRFVAEEPRWCIWLTQRFFPDGVLAAVDWLEDAWYEHALQLALFGELDSC